MCLGVATDPKHSLLDSNILVDFSLLLAEHPGARVNAWLHLSSFRSVLHIHLFKLLLKVIMGQIWRYEARVVETLLMINHQLARIRPFKLYLLE